MGPSEVDTSLRGVFYLYAIDHDFLRDLHQTDIVPYHPDVGGIMVLVKINFP